MTLSPQARALRGFAVDFLTSHDTSAVEWVMDPGYRLSIGGHLFDGRDGEYLPATAAQLDQFPGLTVTVHDVILGEGGVAMRFTEHGASLRDEGRVAAWRGITLFQLHDGRLAHGWAEEDYFARKRQLKSGVPDAVAAPALAPWDQPVLSSDAATEAVVRAWLAAIVTASTYPGEGRGPVVLTAGADHQRPPTGPLPSPGWSAGEPVMVDGPTFADLIAPDAVTVSHLFTAGPRAACHVECHGAYTGGFDDIDRALIGQPVTLRLAAMMDVADGAVVRAQVSGDRLGLHRQLLALQRKN